MRDHLGEWRELTSFVRNITMTPSTPPTSSALIMRAGSPVIARSGAGASGLLHRAARAVRDHFGEWHKRDTVRAQSCDDGQHGVGVQL